MNILLLSGWYPNKHDLGDGIFVQKHAELIAEKQNLVVLTIIEDALIRNEKRLFEINKRDKLTEIIAYYKPPKSNNFLSKGYKYLRYLKTAWKGYHIAYKLLDNKIDLIHLNIAFPAGIAALFLYYFKNINYVLTEHWTGYIDRNDHYSNAGFFKKAIIKKVFHHASAISVVSKYLGEQIKARGLIKKEYKVIPNVVEIPKKLPVSTSNATLKIISISDLRDDTKNISTLLHAIQVIRIPYPSIELHIFGAGKDERKLKQLATDIGILDKHVFFRGFLPYAELVRFMQKASFFVLNSNVETFSVATAEAIGNGLPVVVTKSGAVEEYINEENGILVELNDLESLSFGILKMIKQYKNYDKTKLNNYIREKFNSKNIAQQFEQLYQQSI